MDPNAHLRNELLRDAEAWCQRLGAVPEAVLASGDRAFAGVEAWRPAEIGAGEFGDQVSGESVDEASHDNWQAEPDPVDPAKREATRELRGRCPFKFDPEDTAGKVGIGGAVRSDRAGGKAACGAIVDNTVPQLQPRRPR